MREGRGQGAAGRGEERRPLLERARRPSRVRQWRRSDAAQDAGSLWSEGGGEKKQPGARFFPPMSFINERKYSTNRPGMHRGRQESEPQTPGVKGLITSEVERGGAGERDTGGRAPAPLGTTDHGRAGVVCWSHGENSLKTFHIPPPVPVPLFVDRVSGSLVTGSLGVSPQDPVLPLPGAGPTCPPPKNK